MKLELKKLMEELQRKLDAAQQPREVIEAAVKATMTAQFDKEMAVAVEAKRKHRASERGTTGHAEDSGESQKRQRAAGQERNKRGSHSGSYTEGTGEGANPNLGTPACRERE